jgi:hypothetical protein
MSLTIWDGTSVKVSSLLAQQPWRGRLGGQGRDRAARKKRCPRARSPMMLNDAMSYPARAVFVGDASPACARALPPALRFGETSRRGKQGKGSGR